MKMLSSAYIQIHSRMFSALEANTMNRDQTAPLTWVFITCICNMGYQGA